MKKSMVFIALFVSSVLFSSLSFAATSIRAEVKGMVCAFCAQGIEKKFKGMSQTQGVYVNLKQRIVLVELKDQQRLALDAFSKVIQDAGYDVAKAEYVDKPITDIKNEMGLADLKAEPMPEAHE
jgi:mercuric ion binding protein